MSTQMLQSLDAFYMDDTKFLRMSKEAKVNEIKRALDEIHFRAFLYNKYIHEIPMGSSINDIDNWVLTKINFNQLFTNIDYLTSVTGRRKTMTEQEISDSDGMEMQEYSHPRILRIG